ncbi:hypothetical protein PACTADRAFT_49302 [Pachysolen tannophilus NRRL Y-2460]|uniref:Uncharacterized protein n=1 Tax=Pachysolen tannophilus NRRL Y-2460 TaxID=669874 RepID=A0A1E4TVT6_PACTA|nr:hypothetical protein PACTADRAFT_49302 [Pachysolen tannophilus NRRL Y-2460]
MDIHRCRFVDFTPHTITSLAFSHQSTRKFTPTDLRLAVGRANGNIEIWNPRHNWVHEQTLQGGKNRSIEGLVWSIWDNIVPRLFSIGGSTTITEWDLKTGLPLKNHDCNAGIIWSVACSADGRKLAVGCDDGSVVIIDISGGPGSLEHESILQRQDSRVLSITWHENDLVIGGCADGRVRVWNFKQNDSNKARLVSTLRVDKSKKESTLIWSVISLPTQGQFVTGDSTGSIKFWDVQHFVLQQSFEVHDADVLCLASDLTGEKIFSAGVDRKIFNFNLLKSEDGNSKWINSSNRLLHTNDVRSMCTFESKGANFLVSGGVERTIVVNSVNNLHDGPYRKLPITLQDPNIIVNLSNRYVIMWQDQTIKIWKILSDIQNKKLVSKLTLADDSNITSVAISANGKFLAVGRLTGIKIFKLTETTDERNQIHLKVNRIESKLLENFNSRYLTFTPKDLLLIVSADNELISFKVNINANEGEDDVGEIEFINDNQDVIEYELPEELVTKSKLSHIQNINNLKISENGSQVAISRLNGSVEIVDLDNTESYRLVKLSSAATALEFTSRNTLVLVNSENKLYEFNVSKESINSAKLLTSWSKRNSEFLPSKFMNLQTKCSGIFNDTLNDTRIWLFGDNWLCFFDLNYNIPIDEKFGNTGNRQNNQQFNIKEKKRINKKKRRNSSIVMTISEATNTVDDSINEDYLEDNDEELLANGESVEIIDGIDSEFARSLRQTEINRIKAESNGTVNQENIDELEKSFWMTQKYSSLMLVDKFGANEIIVIERPVFQLPSAPAFKLNKIHV